MSYYITTFDVCADGGFILAGQWGDIYHPVKFGGLLMKLDSAGEFQWMTAFPAWEVFGHEDVVIFHWVEELADGSFIVVGASCFDVPGEYNLTLVKFNSTGGLLWNRSYPIEVSTQGCGIRALADGFLASGAPEHSTAGMEDGPFVVKVDLAGNLQWTKRAPVPMSGSYSLSFSQDGGYVMVGSNGSSQLLSKLNSNLNPLWQNYFTISGMSLHLAGGRSNGNVWALFKGPSANTTTLSLLDSNGNSLWSTSTYWGVEAEYLSPLQETADGGLLVGGQFIESASNVTGFMAKMDSTGHMAWTRTVDVAGAATPLFCATPVSDGFLGVGTAANYTMMAFKTAYAIKLAGGEGPPKQNAYLILNSSETEVTVGESFNLAGSLSVPRSGPVTLLWSINGSGFVHSQTLTMVGGQFSSSFSAGAPGIWAFKAAWAGDSEYNSAESNTVSVSVNQMQPTTVNVTFSANGVIDYAGPVLVVDGGIVQFSELAKTYGWSQGTSHTFSWQSPLTVSATKRYIWASASGLSAQPSGTLSITSSGSVSASYKTQHYATVSAGAGGAVNASSGWWNASSSMIIMATPNTGYGFKNWVVSGGLTVSHPESPTTSVTVTGAGSVEATFEPLPLNVSFSQSGIGADYAGVVLNIDGAPIFRADLTKTFGWTAGSNHAFAWLSPLAVSAEKQYVWISTSGLSGAQASSITVTAQGAISASFKTQFHITIGSGAGGSVSRASGWYDASALVSITATPDPLYGFKSWVTTGGVSVSDPYEPTTSMTVTGAGTVQALFELLPVPLTFSQTGIGTDFTGAVMSVDGTAILRSQLAMTYNWSVGSDHTFSWLSPLVVSPDKRYAWSSTSGLSTSQSGTVTTPAAGGGIQGAYKTQYSIAIAAGAGGSVDKAGGWYDASLPYSISATPDAGYAFEGWVVSGGVNVSNLNSATTTMTMTSSGTVQALFEPLPAGVSFMASGIGTDFSGAVLDVDGSAVQLSELTKTYSWVVGSSHTFSWLSPLNLSPEKRYIWVTTSGLSRLQTGSISSSISGALMGSYVAEYYVVAESSPGGSTSLPSEGWYRDGMTGSISAVPSSGYQFVVWTATGGVTLANSTEITTTFTVNGPGTLRADFIHVLDSVVVTIRSSPGGSTTPSGTYVYGVGSTVEVTAIPSSGYEFAGWTLEGNATLADLASPSTMLSVGGQATVIAEFEPIECDEFTVIFLASTGGSVSPLGSIIYSGATLIVITAIPEEGQRFSAWNVMGHVEVENSASATTSLTVRGNGTVVAHFQPAESDLPFVEAVSPANGSTVDGGTVRINATFSEDAEIEPSTVMLRVDGVEVSGVEVTEYGVAYNAMLQPGGHTVELTVNDALGNARKASWSLVAVEPFSISLEIYAAIAAEVFVAVLIVHIWWSGRKPSLAPRPEKPVIRHSGAHPSE